MVAIPITQQQAQVGFDAFIFLGTLGLTFKAFEARLQFAENIQDSLEVAAGCFQAVEGFFTPGAVEADAGGLFKKAAALFRAQGEGGINQTLTNDGIGSF